MEIFRNYISKCDKKVTMEDSWSKVVCQWASGLGLSTDVKNLMTLTDGTVYFNYYQSFMFIPRYFRKILRSLHREVSTLEFPK